MKIEYASVKFAVKYYHTQNDRKRKDGNKTEQ